MIESIFHLLNFMSFIYQFETVWKPSKIYGKLIKNRIIGWIDVQILNLLLIVNLGGLYVKLSRAHNCKNCEVKFILVFLSFQRLNIWHSLTSFWNCFVFTYRCLGCLYWVFYLFCIKEIIERKTLQPDHIFMGGGLREQ